MFGRIKTWKKRTLRDNYVSEMKGTEVQVSGSNIAILMPLSVFTKSNAITAAHQNRKE